MKGFHNINGIRVLLYHGVMLTLLLLVLIITGCRRELYLYADQFKQVRLDVDWRDYQQPDPQGMTAWFFPENYIHDSFRHTTHEVRSTELYLGMGNYTGVVIDYSPEEMSHQKFIGMEKKETAKVEVVPTSYQPESGDELFEPTLYHELLPIDSNTGLCTVMDQPQWMACDIVNDMNINTGKYAEYIPYDERDEYQQTLEMQVFNAQPKSIIWKLRVYVYVKGIYYLSSVKGSIMGMADGNYLALGSHSNTPCLHELNDWESKTITDELGITSNEGYVAITINTFGLMNRVYAEDDLVLNLRFLLRDRETVVTYHYNVGHIIDIFEDQLVARIDLTKDRIVGLPDLPYAEPYNGAGFDGIVVPWEEGAEADVTF